MLASIQSTHAAAYRARDRFAGSHTVAVGPATPPVFRLLWVTWLTANICMWMNEVASAWLMTTLTSSPVMIALVQSASVLPVVLFGLPSGALADILNRRRWFMFTQFWVAANALILCAVLAADAMTAPLLLRVDLRQRHRSRDALARLCSDDSGARAAVVSYRLQLR